MQWRMYLSLLLLTSWGVAMFCLNCRTQLDIEKVCPMSYGHVMLQTNTSSVTACSLLCASDLTCRTIIYDPATTICTLNTLPQWAVGGVLRFPQNCPLLVYYGFLRKHTCLDVWLLDHCETDADCTLAKSSCITVHPRDPRMCLCDSGYSYNFRNNSCLSRCNTYGFWFMRDVYYIENHNFEERKVQNARECQSLCFFTYTAKCRLVHYIANDPDVQCYLSAETTLTKPDAKRLITNPSAITYIRGCA